MKAVTTTLYVCAGLMATAAIMGFIDYKVAKHKGSLGNLYKEEKPTPVVRQVKTIDVEDYSRGEIKRIEEKAPTKESRASRKEEPTTEVVSVTYTPPVIEEVKAEEELKKPIAKTRMKLKFSEFSRGPLPRKYAVDVEVKAITDSVESKAWDY